MKLDKRKKVKETKEQPAETQTQTPETNVKTSKKHRETKRAVATNNLASSGDTKVLQKNTGSNKVVVKQVGEQ